MKETERILASILRARVDAAMARPSELRLAKRASGAPVPDTTPMVGRIRPTRSAILRACAAVYGEGR